MDDYFNAHVYWKAAFLLGHFVIGILAGAYLGNKLDRWLNR